MNSPPASASAPHSGPATHACTHTHVCPRVCPQSRYTQAKLSVHDRALKVTAVVESLEREMELLCLTGVEDQLQADVRPTLETLRNAGIKVGPASGPGGSPGGYSTIPWAVPS